MWQGWLGIVVTYVILVSISIFLITSPKIKLIIKICLIPTIIWFSVALYYGANSLKGHPIDGEPPYGSFVVGVHVVEKGYRDVDAAIFLTVVSPEKAVLETFAHPVDPTQVYIYFKDGEPILYKLPYDREMHRQLREAMELSASSGGQMIYGKKRGKSTGNYLPGDRGFTILNPFDVLKKGEAE